MSPASPARLTHDNHQQPLLSTTAGRAKGALLGVCHAMGLGSHPRRAEWELAGERVMRAALELIEGEDRALSASS